MAAGLRAAQRTGDGGAPSTTKAIAASLAVSSFSANTHTRTHTRAHTHTHAHTQTHLDSGARALEAAEAERLELRARGEKGLGVRYAQLRLPRPQEGRKQQRGGGRRQEDAQHGQRARQQPVPVGGSGSGSGSGGCAVSDRGGEAGETLIARRESGGDAVVPSFPLSRPLPPLAPGAAL